MRKLSAAEEAGAGLLRAGLTLAVAESCTGGLLSSLITDTPGCSAYYYGGIISYSNEVKINILNVSQKTIDTFGAVSVETAIEMAEGVREALFSTTSLAITGIAGPAGGTTDKPVGTVFIALAVKDKKTLVQKFNFKGSRDEVRRQSALTALEMLNNATK